ncbi:hypothetical protein BTO30_16240 [Domibacillus antri]|uniref:dUTPase n=1 Tax=Domibacillus antri TaxID=1714264 RepID=A0A1Q8Q1K7_9BACI|nr:dUTP diphosphatase [Domibacillus antri]OLN21198.1 hypothetical protein BTO30_16240 [Domibacillus antri]
MILTKLIDMQRVLDEHIMNEHPELKGQDNLDWKILALIAEIGECANEWRGFKKWSNNQKPCTWKRENCPDCFTKGYWRGNPPVDKEKGAHALGNHWYHCEKCAGYLVVDRNPLLEEYVDCLHFILSIVIELGHEKLEYWEWPHEFEITAGFIGLAGRSRDINMFWDLEGAVDIVHTENLLSQFVALGKKLSFTWEQIEEAYFAKNAVNHQRQESGY